MLRHLSLVVASLGDEVEAVLLVTPFRSPVLKLVLYPMRIRGPQDRLGNLVSLTGAEYGDDLHLKPKADSGMPKNGVARVIVSLFQKEK